MIADTIEGIIDEMEMDAQNAHDTWMQYSGEQWSAKEVADMLFEYVRRLKAADFENRW